MVKPHGIKKQAKSLPDLDFEEKATMSYEWWIQCQCGRQLDNVRNLDATQVKLCLLRLQVRLLCSFNAEKLQKRSFGGSERFKILGRSTQPLWVHPDNRYNFCGSFYNIQFELCIIDAKLSM